jgi:hypothetical protein
MNQHLKTHALADRARFALALFLLASSQFVHAYTISITAGTRAVFLAVGSLTYQANNATVNEVGLDLPAAQVGTGSAQLMNSARPNKSTQQNSPIDNYVLCTAASGDVFVDAYFRTTAGSASTATLQVSTPAALTSGIYSIPFSEISWVSRANDGTGADLPNGIFANGGAVTLKTLGANKYIESCLAFTYANTLPRAAGTYTGQAVYTMSAP